MLHADFALWLNVNVNVGEALLSPTERSDQVHPAEQLNCLALVANRLGERLERACSLGAGSYCIFLFRATKLGFCEENHWQPGTQTPAGSAGAVILHTAQSS